MLCQQETHSPDGQMYPLANWDNGINLIDVLRGVIKRSLISGRYCEYFANARYAPHSFTHPFVQQILLLYSVCVRSDSTGIKVMRDNKETENPSLSHSPCKVDRVQESRHYESTRTVYYVAAPGALDSFFSSLAMVYALATSSW